MHRVYVISLAITECILDYCSWLYHVMSTHLGYNMLPHYLKCKHINLICEIQLYITYVHYSGITPLQ
jgi:hypothetical protein